MFRIRNKLVLNCICPLRWTEGFELPFDISRQMILIECGIHLQKFVTRKPLISSIFAMINFALNRGRYTVRWDRLQEHGDSAKSHRPPQSALTLELQEMVEQTSPLILKMFEKIDLSPVLSQGNKKLS
jgi:hypothetical protein